MNYGPAQNSKSQVDYHNCPKENPYTRLTNKGPEYIYSFFQKAMGGKNKAYNKNKTSEGKKDHAENSRKRRCLIKRYAWQAPEISFESQHA